MAKLKYGINWIDEITDLQIELFSFLTGTAKHGGDPDNRPMHFKNIVRAYWGPKSKKYFVWNDWNEKMLDRACQTNWLGLSGCAASGKTDFGAIWGLVNWLSCPTKTCVLFTSTGLAESRKRIWGRVEEYYMAANQHAKSTGLPQMPGKLTSSTGKIKTEGDGLQFSDRSGIHLIAGDRAKEKENIGKLIGLHNDRVILVCDEMPELSPALTEAALSNLAANPFFQMMGLGNFASIYDPFGQFVTPKAGWGSINEDAEEYETERGICLRFDGLKSPNILMGEEYYPGLYSARHLKEHKEGLGENSARFWRMCRSYPCPEADANRIYSDADFIKGKVNDRFTWVKSPEPVAVLDPAFVSGGDKAMAYFGFIGDSSEGKKILQFTDCKELIEDIRKKDETKSLQVAKQFRDECDKRSIPPENAAFDASGAGIVFGTLLSEVWSTKPYGIQSGGAASNRPAGAKDRRPGREAYFNRIAEIWYSGLEYVQSGQIRNIPQAAIKDLTERRYDTVKGVTGLKVRVEQKKDMKARIGHSPDDGDAAMLMVELCKERFGFMPSGMEGKRGVQQNTWKKRAELAARIWRNSDYAVAEVTA